MEFSIEVVVSLIGTFGVVIPSLLAYFISRRKTDSEVSEKVSVAWEKLSAKLSERIQALETEVKCLSEENFKLKAENREILIELEEVRVINKRQREKIAELVSLVEKLKSNNVG